MEQYTKPENKFKILIIDDEGDTCYLLKNVLKDEHFEIEHVNTLAQADVFLKEEHPSLIFLDNRLPDGLGMNALQTLKDDYPNMKIVMITGSGSSSDKKKAINRGADVYLTKPFTREQVFEAVEQLSGVHLEA